MPFYSDAIVKLLKRGYFALKLNFWQQFYTELSILKFLRYVAHVNILLEWIGGFSEEIKTI